MQTAALVAIAFTIGCVAHHHYRRWCWRRWLDAMIAEIQQNQRILMRTRQRAAQNERILARVSELRRTLPDVPIDRYAPKGLVA